MNHGFSCRSNDLIYFQFAIKRFVCVCVCAVIKKIDVNVLAVLPEEDFKELNYTRFTSMSSEYSNGKSELFFFLMRISLFSSNSRSENKAFKSALYCKYNLIILSVPL